ncbi:MAG: GtrA family protein [Dehalococcoidia bacterium]
MVRRALDRRIARIALAGATSAAVDFAVFNALLFAFDVRDAALVIAINTVSFGCAMAVNYTLNARYSFGVSLSRRSATAYVVFTAVGLLLYNVNLLWIRGVLSAEGALMLNASKVAAMGLLVVWNYFGYHRFVFRDASEEAE